MRGFSLFLLACFAAAPALAEPAGPTDKPAAAVPQASTGDDDAADNMVATNWSLKKPKAPLRRVARQGGTSAGPSRTTVRSASRPRVVGGVSVNSAYRRKSNANVGLAIPF